MCRSKGLRSLPFFLWLAFALFCLARTVMAEPSSAPSGNPPLIQETQESPSLNAAIVSLQPQWLLFRERFQGFNGNLTEFLDQVEAFGISFEDLPNYLTFLTSSLQNYSEAYQASMTAAIADKAQADKEIKWLKIKEWGYRVIVAGITVLYITK